MSFKDILESKLDEKEKIVKLKTLFLEKYGESDIEEVLGKILEQGLLNSRSFDDPEVVAFGKVAADITPDLTEEDFYRGVK